MASVYCSREVSFLVKEDEQEILQKAHNILSDIRHKWNMQDDNAWDSDEYWEIDNAIMCLENQFKCSKK